MQMPVNRIGHSDPLSTPADPSTATKAVTSCYVDTNGVREDVAHPLSFSHAGTAVSRATDAIVIAGGLAYVHFCIVYVWGGGGGMVLVYACSECTCVLSCACLLECLCVSGVCVSGVCVSVFVCRCVCRMCGV